VNNNSGYGVENNKFGVVNNNLSYGVGSNNPGYGVGNSGFVNNRNGNRKYILEILLVK
jgi:hypothetical protein